MLIQFYAEKLLFKPCLGLALSPGEPGEPGSVDSVLVAGLSWPAQSVSWSGGATE